MKSEFLQTLSNRGYVHQCTNIENLDSLISSSNISAYIGFDCTAKSLHVGNLLGIMMLRVAQKTGIRPIVLLGGATTQIGDPSGKDEMRKCLTQEEIIENKNSIKAIFHQFLDFSGPNPPIILDNIDWLEKLGYIEFLKSYGRYFSINRMLTFDSVRLRLDREQSLSFLEFNYMIFQSYDFLRLYKDYNCFLQMGGSDQWGNIVSGVDLISKSEGKEVFGLTAPLITTSGGQKMGKTASGAVWLRSEMLSPYDYWQFWRNTPDNDVVKFLKMYTDLPLAKIAELEKLKDRELNEAKIILANEATKMCHGIEASESAMRTAYSTFTASQFGDDTPEFEIDKKNLSDGIQIFKLFHITGLCESASAAKRLIQGGGAKINNETVVSDTESVNIKHLKEGVIKLSAGRKKHLIVKCKG